MFFLGVWFFFVFFIFVYVIQGCLVAQHGISESSLQVIGLDSYIFTTVVAKNSTTFHRGNM